MPDDEIINKSLNFFQLRANPNLYNTEAGKIIDYSPDLTYVKFVDPSATQETNVFFSQSEIRLNDNIADIFDMENDTFIRWGISLVVKMEWLSLFFIFIFWY